MQVDFFNNNDPYSHPPLVNFNFMLRVEGVWDLPCKAVHSFTKENEYENIQEGGLNDYVHLRRKPISKPFTFTVERYAMVDFGAYDPLHEGAELTLPLLLMVTNYAGEFGNTRRTYVFTGCTVMSKEYGELDAEKSGLLIEKTVIAYRELLTVSVPWDNEASIKNDTYVKSGATHARTTTPAPKSDETLKRQWKFDANNYKGTGTQSALQSESPPKTKKDIRQWAFDKSSSHNYLGVGPRSANKESTNDVNDPSTN